MGKFYIILKKVTHLNKILTTEDSISVEEKEHYLSFPNITWNLFLSFSVSEKKLKLDIFSRIKILNDENEED